jgi:hypothetical protein
LTQNIICRYTTKSKCGGETPVIMLISTALLLDSNIRNSVCTPAKLPYRRVVEGSEIIIKKLTPQYTVGNEFLTSTKSSFGQDSNQLICSFYILQLLSVVI